MKRKYAKSIIGLFVCLALIISFIFLLSDNFTPISAALSPGSFSIAYTQNDWGTGATVNITITNNDSTAISGWTLKWSFPGNQKITNLWGGSFTQTGTSVTVTNAAYNSTIPANKGKISFGFNISYSGSNNIPTNFELNNVSNIPTTSTVVSPSSTITPSPSTKTTTISPSIQTTTSIIPSPTISTTTTKPSTIKIMPLGDSITDGFTVAGAYRIKLWNLINTNGYSVDFVGSQSNGPSELGDRNHEGHSGWRIDQIDTNINSWMDTYKPQIVLLHIGTNDISQNYNISTAPNRLSTLIDKICSKLPTGGKLYVSTLIPLSYASVTNFNNQIGQVVNNSAGKGNPVHLVEMYSALTTADLADGVHPNITGYNKMADVWFKAIQNDLK